MKRSRTSRFAASLAGLFFLACSAHRSYDAGDGGEPGVSGAPGAAGSPAAGGAPGAAGAPARAGGPGAAGAPATQPHAEYYVSPNGDDAGPGTQAQPFRTFIRLLQLARADVTLWVMPGTFAQISTLSLQASGTQATPIRLWAAPGARPIIDFAGQARGTNSRGFVLSGNYWHIRGIEIQNAGDNGMLVSGSNNTVENVRLHNNGDTGLQITVSEGAATNPLFGANNLILNCDSYENLDVATNGENADGFAAKLRIGPGNVFRGCRAWNNADDGWDMFAADDIVVIEDSWSFSNGKAVTGANPAGDGNGFKLGGEPVGVGEGHAPHRLARVAAFENRTCGFTRNNNEESPSLTTCQVRDNPRGDFCDELDPCTPLTTEMTTGTDAKAIQRAADGTLPALR